MNTRLLNTIIGVGTLALVSLSAQAAPVSGQGTWETTLQGRNLDGNASTFEAYYDTTLNVTWLANANNANGPISWDAANTWAANLNVNGVTGWRLPTIVDTGAPGCDWANTGTDCGYNVQTGSAATTVYSEMASLFYDTLGNLGYNDTSGVHPQPGFGLSNTGSFSNFYSGSYWSDLQYAPSTFNGWYFNFHYGNQNKTNKANGLYALAVHPGDISAVPVPAALWLFGSGLIGLLGLARRRKH